MKAHELAKILLEGENLPIATYANNHTYKSGCDSITHSKLKVGLLHTYGGDHIVIGNLADYDRNKPNWYVKKIIHGDPDDCLEFGEYQSFYESCKICSKSNECKIESKKLGNFENE